MWIHLFNLEKEIPMKSQTVRSGSLMMLLLCFLLAPLPATAQECLANCSSTYDQCTSGCSTYACVEECQYYYNQCTAGCDPVLLLEFEEESCGGGMCSEGWYDCMSGCGSRYGYIRHEDGSWWGLRDCSYENGFFSRRVRCYYDRN
jgi:hypothetical protein